MKGLVGFSFVSKEERREEGKTLQPIYRSARRYTVVRNIKRARPIQIRDPTSLDFLASYVSTADINGDLFTNTRSTKKKHRPAPALTSGVN